MDVVVTGDQLGGSHIRLSRLGKEGELRPYHYEVEEKRK